VKLTLNLLLLSFGFLWLGSSAVAQDQLGTINSSPVSCPQTGLSGASCYALDISCPEIPNYTAYVKIISPRNPSGTVLFTTGGDINNIYEDFVFGSVAVQNVVNAGLEAVQLTFGEPFSNGLGWQHDVGGKGVRSASCRYATVVQWLSNQKSDVPLCATGNSAGAQNISEGLAHYGLGNYLTFAELTSGPPFNRVDYACINNQPSANSYCSGLRVGMAAGMGDAVDYIDPPYPGAWCSSSLQTGSSEYQSQFLDDSVTSPDAVLSYPNTQIRFLFGGLDNSAAIRQGLDYQSRISQSTTYGCVKDAPHSIADSLDGAQTIASDLIANCHQQKRHRH
jgi:hypothetical protein